MTGNDWIVLGGVTLVGVGCVFLMSQVWAAKEMRAKRKREWEDQMERWRKD